MGTLLWYKNRMVVLIIHYILVQFRPLPRILKILVLKNRFIKDAGSLNFIEKDIPFRDFISN